MQGILEPVVVFQERGTPTQTPIDYSPYYGDPQNGTPNFEKPFTLNPINPHISPILPQYPKKVLLIVGKSPIAAPT